MERLFKPSLRYEHRDQHGGVSSHFIAGKFVDMPAQNLFRIPQKDLQFPFIGSSAGVKLI